MAQTGREHRQRAVRPTAAGIFVLSTLGGLVGTMSAAGLIPVTPAQAASTHTSHTHRTSHAPHPPPIAKAVVARGDTALVELSDLPSGWAASTAAGTPTRIAPWTPSLARCIGLHGKVTSIKPVKVQSPDFISADHSLAVVDSVSVYPSASSAQAAYAALANPKTPQCMNTIAGPALQSSMQQESTSGTTVGTPTFAALPGNPAASHVTGFTVTIPLASNGRAVTVTSSQVDLVHGALLHQVTFNGNGTPFPAQLEVSVLGAVVRRGGSAS
jgi:hypothetical protein